MNAMNQLFEKGENQTKHNPCTNEKMKLGQQDNSYDEVEVNFLIKHLIFMVQSKAFVMFSSSYFLRTLVALTFFVLFHCLLLVLARSFLFLFTKTQTFKV